MIDFVELSQIVMRLAGMPFFPADENARMGIVEDVGDMVHSLDEARWLVKRTRQLYPKWPGTMEMRAVLSSRVTPRDGVEAVSGSFQDGIIPSELPASQQLAAPDYKQIEARGQPISDDSELVKLVADIARKKPHLAGVRKIQPATDEEIKTLRAEQDRRRIESKPPEDNQQEDKGTNQ